MGQQGGRQAGSREHPLASAGAARQRAAEIARRDGVRLRLLVAGLCGFGLAMVLASSPAYSLSTYGSPWVLFEHQLMWTGIGVCVFFFASRTPLDLLRRCSPMLLAGTTAMLFAVLVPGLGHTAGGSSRWIGFGAINIQPSELMKLAFALFLADLVERREESPDHLRNLVRPILIVLGIAAILILRQPDMGTVVVLGCMSLCALFVAGVRSRLLAGLLVGAAVATAILAIAAPYRRARLFSFLNPFGHASTTGYQVVQSLAAMGSGHLYGQGVGATSATWGWLPNAQTDFVFAVVGGQLGLAGSVAVILAFASLAALGIRIAMRAPDRFSSVVAILVTCWITSQAIVNIGGVVGVLPETGIPLPFISAGGSSLVVLLAATGLLASVVRRTAVIR